ncbi:MAG: DUF5678 domain-containing protein, partial [Thermoproteota archaeon]|nr:DUF5678 domain-containing protein [Thermoproteota archaeon]
NLKWFINNHEMLIDKYQDMFVTIDNQDVVASDKKIEELLDRLKKNSQYTDSVLIPFIQNRNTKFTI